MADREFEERLRRFRPEPPAETMRERALDAALEGRLRGFRPEPASAALGTAVRARVAADAASRRRRARTWQAAAALLIVASVPLNGWIEVSTADVGRRASPSASTVADPASSAVSGIPVPSPVRAIQRIGEMANAWKAVPKRLSALGGWRG